MHGYFSRYGYLCVCVCPYAFHTTTHTHTHTHTHSYAYIQNTQSYKCFKNLECIFYLFITSYLTLFSFTSVNIWYYILLATLYFMFQITVKLCQHCSDFMAWPIRFIRTCYHLATTNT